MTKDQERESQNTSALFKSEKWAALESSNELTINRFRLAAIFLLYLVHLVNFNAQMFGLDPRTDITSEFHRAVTLAAAVWFSTSIMVSIVIRRGFYFWFLKYFTTFTDIVILTFFLWIADGFMSPLLVGYFIILAFCSLRLHLDTVRFAAIGCVASIAFIAWHSKMYRPELLPSFGAIATLLGGIAIISAFEMRKVIKLRNTIANADFKRGLFKESR